MNDSERLEMIRKAVERFNQKQSRTCGAMIEDYVYFIEDVEEALADSIEVVLDD